jgi:hypothetical protein
MRMWTATEAEASSPAVPEAHYQPTITGQAEVHVTYLQASRRLLAAAIVIGGILVVAPSLASAQEVPVEPTTTTANGTPTTVAPSTVADPMFPIAEGANSPAVAVIQQKLGITVDCDFGGQTAQSVRDWQTQRGDIAVTGEIGPQDWDLLDVPIVWGDDANEDGAIAPSEVDIDCADPNFPPEPVMHADWPMTDTGFAAQMCALTDQGGDDPTAYYTPADDTITVSGADVEDFGAAGDTVFDTMICVLGWVSPPQHVIAQLSSTRALDGMQTATWDGLFGQVSALWTFHPDQGMNLTVFTV